MNIKKKTISALMQIMTEVMILHILLSIQSRNFILLLTLLLVILNL